MRKIRIVLFITALAAILAGYALRTVFPERKIDEKAYLKEMLPELKFSEKKQNPPHYRADNGIIAFSTYDIAPSVRGYAGPIKLLLALSPDGRIAGIRILEHQETKNYVHYMETPEYLSRFIGKDVRDQFRIDRDIDGISRATVSVEAMAKTMRDSSRSIASGVLGIETVTNGKRISQSPGWISYLLLFSSAFSFYLLTRRSKRFIRVRDIFLVTGILIIGLYLSSPFSILHVFNLLLLRSSSSLLWLTIILTTFISLVLAGRFYCGWLCPFGALSEFIGRIPLKKWDIRPETDDQWRSLKYLFLGLIAAVVLISRKVEFGNYETYVTLFSFNGTYLAWSLVVISTLANLRIERFWCRYLCPVAAFTGLLSRKAGGYPSRKDCPIGNRPDPLISECIRCNRCYRS
ncbi:MAG: 4Fe-4S binding protein [Nitrospirae bacterium]|nr:4Fe-4S binding protein [Nitrospirota bacterium]